MTFKVIHVKIMIGLSESHKIIQVSFHPGAAWPDIVAGAALGKATSTDLSQQSQLGLSNVVMGPSQPAS